MHGTHDEANFQLMIPGEGCAPDLLGVWQIARGNGSTFNQLAWIVALPAAPAAATESLAWQTVTLQAAQQDLLAARRRLDTFADHARLSVNGAANFTRSAQELPTPERELAALLQIMYGQEAFYGGERLNDRWQGMAHQAQLFLRQVHLSLASYMRLETTLGGVSIGRTIVGWRGDLKTTWRLELASEQTALHQRALALALDSRAAWTRTALHIVAGAARLSSLFVLPGGSYLAIPAAWQFIKQVLADAGRLRDVSST